MMDAFTPENVSRFVEYLSDPSLAELCKREKETLTAGLLRTATEWLAFWGNMTCRVASKVRNIEQHYQSMKDSVDQSFRAMLLEDQRRLAELCFPARSMP